MVLEIIQQITNTEDRSKEIIKKSQISAKQIIEKAKQDSINLLANIQNEAKIEKSTLIEDAINKAKKEIISLQKINDEKINNILQAAKKNEESAIRLITDKIMEK